MKVLLVQPDRQIATMFHDALDPEGISIATVDSANRACQILSCNRSIDLIVASAEIAGPDLSKLFKTVKQVDKIHSTPIVMMSRKWSSSEVTRYLKLGVRDCLSLAVDSETLVQRIRLAQRSDKPSILVVDDDELIRNLLMTVLEIGGFQVETVESGEKALEFLETENRIDGVVSDILMPGMTGIELLAVIKDKYKLPVIMITGFSGRYSPKTAALAGADGYFEKPFKNTALLSELRRVLA